MLLDLRVMVTSKFYLRSSESGRRRCLCGDFADGCEVALEKIKRLVEKGRCKGRKVVAEVADSVPLEMILQTGTSLFTRKQWKVLSG